MSEADSRTVPSRGRSSTRGRGGLARGAPRGLRKQANGTSTDRTVVVEESFEDQGEIGEMKKKYILELSLLRDMFPDWTDTDLVFALQEADGDVPATVDKITQGAVSQFAEVKKPKDRARSKVKEDTTVPATTEKAAGVSRGGRGRGGTESTRGGRGRGSERGRGGFRGGRGGHATTNGTSKDAEAITSITTAESNAWDTPGVHPADGHGVDASSSAAKQATDTTSTPWGNVVASDSTPGAASEGAKPTLIPEGAPKKSWASMFAQPKPAPVAVPAIPKPAPTKEPPPAELVASKQVPAAATTAAEPTATHGEPETVPSVAAVDESANAGLPDLPVVAPVTPVQAEEVPIAPSQVPLTEENVEHLPDESHPPATLTVASTAGSADPRNLTPLPPQQAPIGKSPLGGFATSASSRLAGVAGRSASFQRRVLEQQEAVVMPGHNAVDRAAVQFGSMGLSGDSGPDVDDDREDPETRQPPQHSPPSQPRTSLPPAPRQPSASAQQDSAVADAYANPKQAPGLPPASAQNQQQIQDASLNQAVPQDASFSQMYNQYNQYNRYGQPGLQQDAGAQHQKPYESFGHQAQHSGYDQYGAHTPQPQHQGQSGFGGLTTASSDYSNYYTSDQSRYNYYGAGAYAQQDIRNTPVQHDPAISQRSAVAGFATAPTEASHGNQASQQQSRFADNTGSGNNTPNPLASAQPHSAPNAQHAQQSHHQGQSHQQPGAFASGASAAFPYGHPYYNSPYQAAYQNQFGYTGHQLGYAGGFPQQNKGAMYGAPHGYGSSYDQHSSSPANTGGFSQGPQNVRSTSGMGSSLGGLDEYNRGAAHGSQQQQQQQQQQQHQTSGFGGVSDSFGRSTSGLGGQYAQQAAPGGQEDSLKAYPDTSKGGPSPSLGQPGRPGSAANSIAGSQSGLPPTQAHQSGFGGYPSYPGQGSQYGGLGGLGGHQPNQSGMGAQSGYSGYSAGGFNQTYGNYGGSRGGWGQNYNQH